MSRNGSGTYSLPAGNPVVTGTTISSTDFNNTMTDIATALTQSIAKDGQTVPTANLPMGTYKITGLGAGTAATDAAQLAQVQSGVAALLGGVAGTNTITATGSPTLTAYASGQTFRFIPAATNTGATTINIDSLGAKNVYYRGAALAGGEIRSGVVAHVTYDGTQFCLVDSNGVFPAGTASAPSIAAAGDANTGVFFPAADTVAVTTGGTERVRVDSAGNLGLGVTPSASSYKNFQINTTGVIGSAAGYIWLGNNWVYNSGDKYIANGYATLYGLNEGAHTWYIAPSGTAGNAITFTQAMALNSSGNLQLGTTTDAARATIYAANNNGTTFGLKVRSSTGTEILIVRDDYVSVPNNYNITTGSAANIYFGSDGYLYRSTSSARYKTDIQPYTRGVVDVLKLAPVFYKGTGASDDGKQYAGLIAEDVHGAGLTEYVVYDSYGRPDALHYANMAALWTKAIQELAAQNAALTARVVELEAK